MKRLAFMAGCLVILASGAEAARVRFSGTVGSAGAHTFSSGDRFTGVFLATQARGFQPVEALSRTSIDLSVLGGLSSAGQSGVQIDCPYGYDVPDGLPSSMTVPQQGQGLTDTRCICDSSCGDEECGIGDFPGVCDTADTKGIPAPGGLVLVSFGVAALSWLRCRRTL